jgi:Flp pilus assembly protein TadD
MNLGAWLKRSQWIAQPTQHVDGNRGRSASCWTAAWLTLVAVGVLAFGTGCRPAATDEFARLMNTGKTYYDRGEAERAIEPFSRAVLLNPTHPDAHLNLANAYLLAGDATNALRHAREVVALDNHSAAGFYVKGCAHLRLRQYEEAVQAFQISRENNPRVGATTFHLGRAHQELGQYDAAIAAFQELVSFEPEHPAAHYTLGQTLVRANRTEEGMVALERHRELAAERTTTIDTVRLERCEHTEARVPFLIEYPDPQGLRVVFQDVTAEVLDGADRYHGPIGVIDYHSDGRNSLFVLEGEDGFRLLSNSNGTFRPHGEVLPRLAGATYHRCLVADLQNNRYQDVLMIGDQGSHLYRFATNAQVFDSTSFSRMAQVPAVDGTLLDLEFTGNLDLVTINADRQGLQVMRNRGRLFFTDTTVTSGVPATVTGAIQLAVDDWTNNELLDIVIARRDEPPLLLLKERGGQPVPTNAPPDWPVAHAVAFGDFNNDLRADLVLATADRLEIVLNGLTNRIRIPLDGRAVTRIFPIDYDNDGWLDIATIGDGIRMWRNLGRDTFREVTRDLTLDRIQGQVEHIAAADFDLDGDTDLVVSLAGQGLRILRNQGANANLQVKVQLQGNRSNASGIGTRVDVTSGGLRLGRRVMSLPIEIGVGQHRQLESLDARWLNLTMPYVDLEVDPRQTVPIIEVSIPEGSCPYLYAWDGSGFRFITDILSASPAGLRLSEDRFVEADPDEFVWIGDETMFPPRNDHYAVQVTEELREVLYLDAAELIVVDHPIGTEVFPTSKMVPGRPFPPHELVTLHRPRSLWSAIRSDGLDVTEALREADNLHASPIALRPEPLRGLAEPFSITLDFGPLEVERPLVLAITAWLRFGGAMANVAASFDPELPFPFPLLEVETAPNRFEPVDVVVGTPAGKTKRMIVDLTGQLPPGSRRLRLSTAFELHWDQIVLMEKAGESNTRVVRLTPDIAHLYWRGFSDFKDLDWTLPLTPDFDAVRQNPSWRITPMGWCTRYGDVLELVEQRDDALVLLNGGDALELQFAANRVPGRPDDYRRNFFLFSSGWDKDADFHCAKGWLVDPIPWHGMDDQRYGQEPRPVIDGDWWIPLYNTRWVGQMVPNRPE